MIIDKIQRKREEINEYGFSEIAKRIIVKLFRNNIYIERVLFYRNPRQYWEKRGGERYFKEQESRKDRDLRSIFIAENLVELNVQSVLEVGCGYGKQLKSIRKLDKEVELFGVDFSSTQLIRGKEYLKREDVKYLVCADAEVLPFLDNSFDLVLTSAVIIHSPPEKARHIRDEIFRIAKKYIVHNEDMSISSTRWSYDYGEIYKQMGLNILKCCQIPCAPIPEITQFVVAEKAKENQT